MSVDIYIADNTMHVSYIINIAKLEQAASSITFATTVSRKYYNFSNKNDSSLPQRGLNMWNMRNMQNISVNKITKHGNRIYNK